jgi:hypothetical protein
MMRDASGKRDHRRAGNHCRLYAECLVDRGSPATDIVIVHARQIIMDE